MYEKYKKGQNEMARLLFCTLKVQTVLKGTILLFMKSIEHDGVFSKLMPQGS